MRLLGYPQLISMESFREPNVELVADCIHWLITRYEPSAEVTFNIEREHNRVTFFKQVCEVALAKGRIKLNVKKLYQADGHAVQEMLKLANVLKKAMKATDTEEPDFTALQQMAAQKNVSDAKAVQQLCSELTADGSSLFFLVEGELNSRGDRQRILSRATEVGEFERRLRELLTNVTQEVDQYQQSIVNLSADESNLEQKIENKKAHLERAQKQYKSAMATNPAFLKEYENHEKKLHAQFVDYLEQYRNLEFLEHQIAKYNAKEDAMLEEQETKLKVMRERLRKEELKNIRADSMARRPSGRRGGEDSSGDESTSGDEGSDTDDSRPRQQRGQKQQQRRRPQNAIGHSRGPLVRDGAVNSDEDNHDEEDESLVNQMRRPRVATGARPPAAGGERSRLLANNPAESDSSSEPDSSELSTSTSSGEFSSDDSSDYSGSDDSDI
ncbi:Clusterin-associated protein-1 family protein [Leishmania donovani]|uniref:Clusterin-associated protein-1 family protein n=1 Tax=Leishmania donovani TaxID=5661 RepID=A0A504WYF9_LEIDO|nr:Clusterin-associated protein-1 family protein [Leishmania donovani]